MSAKNNLFELKISLDQSDFLLNLILNLKSNQIKEYATAVHNIIRLQWISYVSYELVRELTSYVHRTCSILYQSQIHSNNGLLVVK